VGDKQYRVVAEVACLSDNICVIDFGLKTTSDGDLLPQSPIIQSETPEVKSRDLFPAPKSYSEIVHKSTCYGT
jgi:hypothetical protein